LAASNAPNISEKLQRLTTELREMEQRFKSDQKPDSAVLQDFRTVLDSTRLTAWMMSELLTVKSLGSDASKVVSFLTAERIRRFTHLAADLYFDAGKGTITSQTTGIGFLMDTLRSLLSRLEKLEK